MDINDNLHHVSITFPSAEGRTFFEIDGEDITEKIQGYSIVHRPGEMTPEVAIVLSRRTPLNFDGVLAKIYVESYREQGVRADDFLAAIDPQELEQLALALASPDKSMGAMFMAALQQMLRRTYDDS